MTMEDPHVTVNDPRGGVDRHLAGEMTDDSDVVVPEDQLDRQSRAQKLREEIEDDRSQGGRSPDNRMLRVTRDEDPVRLGRIGKFDQPLREEVGRALGRAERALGRAAEPQVDIRDNQGSELGRAGGFDDERRSVRHRPERALHDLPSRLTAKTVLRREDAQSPRGRTMLSYIKEVNGLFRGKPGAVRA